MSKMIRPQKNTGKGFLGIQKFGIVDIYNKVDDYDWADIYLEIQIRTENSKYNDKIVIAGEFKKNMDGDIEQSPVISRLYGFLDGIGLDCGIDIKGNWIEANGKEITDITDYIYRRRVNIDDDGIPKEYPYYAYLYKEQNKSNGKLYTKVHTHVFPVTTEGYNTLDDRIKFMKSKGYLKEANPNTQNSASNAKPIFEDEGIEAL